MRRSMIRRLACILICLSFMVACLSTVSFAAAETGTVGTSQTYQLEVSARAVGGRTMVPLRFAGEALGFDVDWNGDTTPQTARVSNADTTVIMTKNKADMVFSSTVTVNGAVLFLSIEGMKHTNT